MTRTPDEDSRRRDEEALDRDTEARQRIGPSLRHALAGGGDSLLPVVIRLTKAESPTPAASGGEAARELEREVSERARPVLELLASTGSEQVRVLWIADAVAAHAPPAAIAPLARLDVVREIQLDERVVALAGKPDEED